MSTYGTIYQGYADLIESWPGYNENNEIDIETYQPLPVADKGYSISFTSNTLDDEGASTGRTEWTANTFELKILFQYPRKRKFSENEARAWACLDQAEKDIYAYSCTAGHIFVKEAIRLLPFSPEFKVAAFTFGVKYLKSLI